MHFLHVDKHVSGIALIDTEMCLENVWRNRAESYDSPSADVRDWTTRRIQWRTRNTFVNSHLHIAASANG